MATSLGDTQVLVAIETRDFIKAISAEDGRQMKYIIDKAVREYAKKHGLTGV